MAGIGFKIQRLLNKDSMTSTAQGYIYGTLVSAGPLLILVLTLACLTRISTDYITLKELHILRAIIIYVYFAALLLTGVLQFTVTRYVADVLYSNRQDKVLSSLFSMLTAILLVSGIIGMLFFPFALGEGNLGLSFRATALLMTVCGTWMIMNYITATRDYHTISWAFAGGGLISIISAYFLGQKYGVYGYLEGYLLGQFLVFSILLMVVNKSFTLIDVFSSEVFTHIKNHQRLLYVGLFINFGLWVDKILFWWSPHGKKTAEMFWTFDSYDSCTFLALLTVIPSMAYFLIRVETGFYIKYRYYYQTLTNKGTYEDVDKARKDLTEELLKSFSKLVIIQCVVTGFCIVYTNEIMEFLKLSPLQWSLFRISLLGSMFLIFLQLMFTVMLYFELQKEVFYLSGLYLILNAFFTYFSIEAGFRFFGFGFTLASFTVLAVGAYVLKRRLSDLLFQTYKSLPVYANQNL